MAYEPIVTVDISISDVQLTSVGFGTPLFITTHRQFKDRVAEYSSAQEIAGIFGTDSAAYRAAVQVFGQSPSPSVLKIGRRDGELRLVPAGTFDGNTYGFTVTLSNGTDYPFTVTGDGASTADTIAEALEISINETAEVAAEVLATRVGGQLTLEKAVGVEDSWFTVHSYLSGEITGKDVWYGTETGADVYTAITEEDNDFYFVAADDNHVSFVTGPTGLAATIETVHKIYFLSDSATYNIDSVTDPDTSLFGQLAASGYNNTVTIFHQNAGQSDVAGTHESADYVELAYIAANATNDAGSVSWANIELKGVPASTNTANGKRLSNTHKSRLNTRNSNYVEFDSGASFTRYGQTVGNEWIDTVRGVHWQNSDMLTNLKALMLGQKGTKVTYDAAGLTQVREVISSSLQRGVNRSFLNDYVVNMPRIQDISSAQKMSRVLSGITFQATLAGAIHEVKVTGRVSS